MTGDFASIDNLIAKLRDDNPEERWAAVDSIRHQLGPEESLPLLLEAMTDSDESVRALAAHACFDMTYDPELIPLLARNIGPLARLLEDESPAIVLEAISLFQALGPDAKPVAPVFEQLTSHPDEELRAAAEETLVLLRLS